MCEYLFVPVEFFFNSIVEDLNLNQDQYHMKRGEDKRRNFSEWIFCGYHEMLSIFYDTF